MFSQNSLFQNWTFQLFWIHDFFENKIIFYQVHVLTCACGSINGTMAGGEVGAANVLHANQDQDLGVNVVTNNAGMANDK